MKTPTFYPAKDIKTVLSALLNFAVAEQWILTNSAKFNTVKYNLYK